MIRRLALLAATLTAAAVLVVAAPQTALAHARLVASDPAGGATLDAAPSQVSLTFSERVETSFAGVQVFDPAGQRVEAGEATVAETTVTVALQPLTAPGTYTVVFRIISGDSHPIESQFAFVYAPPPPPPPAPELSAGADASSSASPAAEPSASPSEPQVAPAPPRIALETAGAGTAVGLWVSRAVNNLALTAVVGLLLGAGVLLANGRDLTAIQRRALRFGATAAAIWALSAGVVFLFGLSNAAARPLPQALTGDLPARFAATRLGGTALVQAGVAAALVLIATFARTRRAAGAALAVTALGAVAPAWWGHAGTTSPAAVALVSGYVHIAVVTVWVGGLAVLAALLLWPAGIAVEPVQPAGRFSALAGWALAAVAVTGTVNALLGLSAPGQLTGTTWGRLVLVKLLLFAALTALGWRNRSRLLPRLSHGGAAGRRAFRSLALAEVALMVLTFGIATGLASSVPAEAEAASRIASLSRAFGDGQINLTVDPATAGPNVVHLYYLDADGRPRAVDDATLTLTSSDGQIDVDLSPAGPGHYAALSQQLPAAGDYEITVGADVDGQPVTTTATLTVR